MTRSHGVHLPGTQGACNAGRKQHHKESCMSVATQALLALAAAMTLAACAAKEPDHTVDWYKAHAAERTAMVARCSANPGELADTPNCINATDATNAKIWASRAGISGVKAPTFGKPRNTDKKGQSTP